MIYNIGKFERVDCNSHVHFLAENFTFNSDVKSENVRHRGRNFCTDVSLAMEYWTKCSS